MTNRIILRAATGTNIALVLVALSIGWDTRSGFIATALGVSAAHSPSLALTALLPVTCHHLSRTSAFKPGSHAAAHLLPMRQAAHGHQLAIGQRAFRADSFIARLLPDTSVSGRAPPLA